MSSCLICDHTVAAFLSFGHMPIANGFLPADAFDQESFYDLSVGLCEHCGMVQLLRVLDRSRLFHARYPFFSSTSRVMDQHFQDLARSVQARLERPDAFVVEIGSNDGTLLNHLAATGTATLGIDPSANVAAVATARNLRTIVRFFDAICAREIVADHGHADAIVATNVFSHVPYLHSVLDGCETLLTARGVVVFEDPYIGDVVAKTAYDQFYDEHALYFGAAPVSRALALHGLELIDVQAQPVHGGSLVYTCARTGAHPVSPRVRAQFAFESARGLATPETLCQMAQRVERSRESLVALLQDLRREGRRVVAYAATAKSTTVLNYCQIGPDLVSYICDSTPMKQGLFSPGMHIPVVSPDRFRAESPDYALLFGWNHADEILAKEAAFSAAGGRWIRYVPQVSVHEPCIVNGAA